MMNIKRKKEIIACKLIDPQNQCVDFNLKVRRDWCRDCLNHIIIINGKRLNEQEEGS